MDKGLLDTSLLIAGNRGGKKEKACWWPTKWGCLSCCADTSASDWYGYDHRETVKVRCWIFTSVSQKCTVPVWNPPTCSREHCLILQLYFRHLAKSWNAYCQMQRWLAYDECSSRISFSCIILNIETKSKECNDQIRAKDQRYASLNAIQVIMQLFKPAVSENKLWTQHWHIITF